MTSRFKSPVSLNDWRLLNAPFAMPGSRFTDALKAPRKAASSGKSGTPKCANTVRRAAVRKPALKSVGGFPTRRFRN